MAFAIGPRPFLRRVGYQKVWAYLGDPAFYRRFGFVPASSAGLRCVYDAPPEAFQVLELVPGALASLSGRVLYAAAFARFE